MTDSLSHPTHKYSLTARIFIGMIAGVLIGFLFKLIMGESGDLQFSALGIAFSIKAIFIRWYIYRFRPNLYCQFKNARRTFGICFTRLWY